jgi:hypothetical protein
MREYQIPHDKHGIQQFVGVIHRFKMTSQEPPSYIGPDKLRQQALTLQERLYRHPVVIDITYQFTRKNPVLVFCRPQVSRQIWGWDIIHGVITAIPIGTLGRSSTIRHSDSPVR